VEVHLELRLAGLELCCSNVIKYACNLRLNSQISILLKLFLVLKNLLNNC
jgi:hypothetical protein